MAGKSLCCVDVFPIETGMFVNIWETLYWKKKIHFCHWTKQRIQNEAIFFSLFSIFLSFFPPNKTQPVSLTKTTISSCVLAVEIKDSLSVLICDCDRHKIPDKHHWPAAKCYSVWECAEVGEWIHGVFHDSIHSRAVSLR